MNIFSRFMKAILLTFFSIFYVSVNAQFVNDCNYVRPHQADQWIFGFNAGLDFYTGDPIASPTADLYDNINGIASISDEEGNLMLFSDGTYVWGSNFQKIPYGTGLDGNYFASQPALFVPYPGNSKKYFLFTVDLYVPAFGYDKGINYTLVDFSGNTYGQVSSKNNQLITSNAQKICAVQHDNGTDYWVLMHGMGASTGNTFYAYLISSDGIDETPVKSIVGFTHIGDEAPYGAGSMKFSPDGSKVALAITDDGVVEVLDFNTATGVVSNPLTSTINQFNYPNDIEFSPDNSKLYMLTTPLQKQTNILYQFDLNASDPFASPYMVQSYEVINDSLAGGLQLGVDGKIYVSVFRESGQGYPDVSVIFNPDRLGEACNYNKLNRTDYPGFNLGGAKTSVGLPNFVSTFLDIPHFTYIDQCHHDTTLFSITNTANIDAADWDFNDNDGDLVINDPFFPGFVFSEPGDYTVNLTETFDGDYYFTENVRIHPLPYVDLGNGADTIYILPNTAVQLDAGDYDFYYWQPGGSTGRYLTVTEEGLYSVMVQDSNCCQNGDQVYIDYTELYYPSAFKPGSSINENAVFKVVGNTMSLGGYLLQIYDRWGQMIFETEDPADGWDGTQSGDPVPLGTYVWKSVFQGFDAGDVPGAEFKYSGTVTLVR
jgi:gliding motility-associated-like protein